MGGLTYQSSCPDRGWVVESDDDEPALTVGGAGALLRVGRGKGRREERSRGDGAEETGRMAQNDGERHLALCHKLT